METSAHSASLPALLQELLQRQYGTLYPEILAGYAAQRRTSLRVNRLRAEPAAIQTALTQAGIVWESVPWYPDALLLPPGMEAALQQLPLYQSGAIYLQSLSAMLPALALEAQPGEDVLDLCAAPGGKTTQLAALTGNQAMITACEREPVRAERLRFNLQRQGASRVSVLQRDGRQLEDFLSFDRILLDAPCSGSGTLSLAPDAPPRRMTADWLRKLNRTQASLLRKAVRLLRPGGILVYATCSILRCENEEIVREALHSGEMVLVPLSPMEVSLPLLPTDLPGTCCIRPTDCFEGFYYVKLQKKK